VDLRQLEILQAIAETGSFTACGRKLHVSQSAISRQILLLEEELGEPLFLRVGRQVRMTPAAESLVQLGKRVFQDGATPWAPSPIGRGSSGASSGSPAG
jgi:DNA-binding transcriptional LysR family regulator